MEYKGKVQIKKEDLKYYRDLLSIEDLEENNDGIGRQDDYIYIASVDFDNNTYITIDLASGLSNYYDNIVLWEKDGDIVNELSCSDCNFDIDSFELFYDEDIYTVEIEEV